MQVTTALKGGVSLVIGLALVFLIVGQLLGQPVLLGYVATGSMEPALNAGDGFVAVPSVIADDPEPGDVVVFDAQTLHEGGLTTHRVVEVTDEGYVTKGDANPFTDQDGNEPPVTDGQIVAVAWQVNGTLVRLPHLGTLIMSVHSVVAAIFGVLVAPLGIAAAFDADGIGALLVALGIGLLGVGLLLERTGATERETGRKTRRENVIGLWTAISIVVLLLALFATAAMVIPAGGATYEVMATENPTADPQTVPPGEVATVTRTIDNSGYVPIVAVLDTADGGVTVEPRSTTVSLQSTSEVTISMTAPDTEGRATKTVYENRYLLVLPPSVLVWLHGIHPFVAIAAVNVVVVGVAVGLILALFGRSDFRLRSTGRNVSLVTRLDRLMDRWL